MSNRYILYQAYGSPEILAECKFAILRLLRYNTPASFRLVIYTDSPTYFAAELPLFHAAKVQLITAEQIAEWRGKIDFVHRVKIKVLQDFCRRYTGSLLYCDTDTYCLQPLEELFLAIEKGSIYMHIDEGPIDKPENLLTKKLYHFLKKTKPVFKNKTIPANGITMWNAGVIGITTAATTQLQQVLDLTEKIYPIFPKHVAEQFAFSYIFQQQGNIAAAAPYFFHYWNLKEYRWLLQSLFSGFSSDELRLFTQTDHSRLPEKILTKKLQFEGLPFLKKIFSKKWDIRQYQS